MKKTKGEKIFNIFNVVLMLVIAFVMVYPFYYVLVASLSKSADFMMYRGFLYKPLGFNFDAYRIVFRNDRILRGFVNTLFILVTRVSLAMLLTVIGAYVLSRKKAMLVPGLMFLIIIPLK